MCVLFCVISFRFFDAPCVPCQCRIITKSKRARRDMGAHSVLQLYVRTSLVISPTSTYGSHFSLSWTKRILCIQNNNNVKFICIQNSECVDLQCSFFQLPAIVETEASNEERKQLSFNSYQRPIRISNNFSHLPFTNAERSLRCQTHHSFLYNASGFSA